MFRALFTRSFARASIERASGPSSHRLAETFPPQESAGRPWSARLGAWLGASGWRVSTAELRSSFGGGTLPDGLVLARFDFVDALQDVRTPNADLAIDRIAVTRSLHELWHFRGEVFGHVSCRHDQAEATRRLAVLDRHFARRSARSGPTRDPTAAATTR
jgi:hypothetical protein